MQGTLSLDSIPEKKVQRDAVGQSKGKSVCFQIYLSIVLSKVCLIQCVSKIIFLFLCVFQFPEVIFDFVEIPPIIKLFESQFSCLLHFLQFTWIIHCLLISLAAIIMFFNINLVNFKQL